MMEPLISIQIQGDREFFEPGDQGDEAVVRDRLEAWRVRDRQEAIEKRVRRYLNDEN